jgi:hypothetical protein
LRGRLWYTSDYPEQAWIRDWVSVQEWLHGIGRTLGATDTVTVNTFASNGAPTVIGFDLRNEPHTPSGTYLSAATWGSGDGIHVVTATNSAGESANSSQVSAIPVASKRKNR